MSTSDHVKVQHKFALQGWRDGGLVHENPERVGIFLVAATDKVKYTDASVVETTHGYNANPAAMTLLGIEPVDGAPELEVDGQVFIKLYNRRGITPTNLDRFLADFPIIEASEGFINTFKRSIEHASAKASTNQTDRLDRKAAKLKRREERRAAKKNKAAPVAERSPRAVRASDSAVEMAITAVEDGTLFTHSYTDNLTAKAAFDQIASRFTGQEVKAFISCTAPVCKFIDPQSGKKRVHDGPASLEDAEIVDFGRVWMTVQKRSVNGGPTVTWFLKVIALGANISIRVGEASASA